MDPNRLAACRILVVEDEYYLAEDVRSVLAMVGAEIVGPVPTAAAAAALIERDPGIGCVLLDVNLRGDMAFDVADALQARRIPFAVLTGYDRHALPDRLSGVPILAKPVDAEQLVRTCEQLTGRGRPTAGT